MKVAMIDPSLFTGRYDDGLCAALAGQGHDVTLMGRPLRRTDAIMPTGYRYDPAFFRLSEALRPMIGEGLPFRAMKGVGHMLRCAAGSVAPFAGRDVAHFQWLPLARADAMLLRLDFVYSIFPFFFAVVLLRLALVVRELAGAGWRREIGRAHV